MAFQFRLEKVLKYRQRLVDRQAQELAGANRLVVEISQRIDNLGQEIQGYQTGHPLARTMLSTRDRIYLSQWILHLREKQMGLEDRRREYRLELEAQQEKMTRAWQDLEVLKKLKVRQKELWQTEIQKRENQDMDEVGIQRADRMRRENLATT